MRRFFLKYGIGFELVILFFAGVYYLGNHYRSSPAMTQIEGEDEGEKDYIKWVEFDVPSDALKKAYELDVSTYEQDVHLNWIELLAYLATTYGGDFSKYKAKDMEELAAQLTDKSTTMEALTAERKHYAYYLEAYTAVLGGLVGEYEIETLVEENTKKPNSSITMSPEATKVPDKNEAEENGSRSTPDKNAAEETGSTKAPDKDAAEGNSSTKAPDKDAADDSGITEEPEENTVEKVWEKKYGLKAFNPIGRGYEYSDSDDFGNSRTYGYERKHLGHDMFGQTGTPVIAVESGYVEAIGWNKYGGWRLGIRSFDKKRYYYYAHLRQNFPYNKSLKEGSVVTAGDVIGYMGHTGYSETENVNNIKVTHLHWGLQLIFDESQKEGSNEIWVNCYELTKFLSQKRCTTVKDESTKEYSRVYQMKDPAVEEYLNAAVE